MTFLIRVARTLEQMNKNWDGYGPKEIKAFLILAAKMCRQESRSPGYWVKHHRKQRKRSGKENHERR